MSFLSLTCEIFRNKVAKATAAVLCAPDAVFLAVICWSQCCSLQFFVELTEVVIVSWTIYLILITGIRSNVYLDTVRQNVKTGLL